MAAPSYPADIVQHPRSHGGQTRKSPGKNLAKSSGKDLAKLCVADLNLGGCPPQLNCEEVVPDPSGKVLAKFRGKVLAKLSTKTPGKAARQRVLGRAVKLPSARKNTVRCGHSLVTQGILPAAKLYWHLHYKKKDVLRLRAGVEDVLRGRHNLREPYPTVVLCDVHCMNFTIS